LGEPWKFDGRTALYQTSEVRDPRGILFVAGQTAKEGNTYLYAWDMEKQIHRVGRYQGRDRAMEASKKKASEVADVLSANPMTLVSVRRVGEVAVHHYRLTDCPRPGAVSSG